jgi:gliding motility-associated-like protein
MSQRPFYSILLWNFFFRRLPGLFLFLGVMPVVHGQALDLETNVIAGTCGNTNDTMVVIVSGGTSPYQVSITGGPTVIAPFTLSLSGTATSVSKQFTGLGLGNYIITVTDAGTPPAQATKIQPISSIPGPISANASVSARPTCLNNDGAAEVSVVGGTLPYTFLYNGATVGMTTATSSSGEATGLPSGNLTLTVSDGNGCTIPGPVFMPLNDNLTLTMGNDITICQGTSQQLAITSNGSSFSWSPATGLSSVSAEDPVASPQVSTAYTVTTSLGVCPPQQGSVNVVVLPAPVPTAISPDTTCYGKAIYLSGSGGTKYSWTPTTYLNNPTVSNPLVVDPTSSIVYSLSVTDANGCKSLKPAVVDLFVRAPYVVSAVPDTSVMVGQSVDLQAIDVQGVGFDQFIWTPGVFLNNPSVADPVGSFSETGIYSYLVTATAPNGCSAVDSVTVKVYAVADIFVPNAFTPNGDGHNDVLRALPVSMRSFKYLTVFNRWGQQVFTTTNAGVGWDGTFGGQPAPEGTYVWMVGGVDYTGRVVEKRGTVVLIR